MRFIVSASSSDPLIVPPPSPARAPPRAQKMTASRTSNKAPAFPEGSKPWKGHREKLQPVRVDDGCREGGFATRLLTLECTGDWMYGANRAMCGGTRAGAGNMKKGSEASREPQKLESQLDRLLELN